MLSRALFEFLDMLLQDLRENELIVGVITVVLSRDFLQRLLLIPSERRSVDEEGYDQ